MHHLLASMWHFPVLCLRFHGTEILLYVKKILLVLQFFVWIPLLNDFKKRFDLFFPKHHLVETNGQNRWMSVNLYFISSGKNNCMLVFMNQFNPYQPLEFVYIAFPLLLLFSDVALTVTDKKLRNYQERLPLSRSPSHALFRTKLMCKSFLNQSEILKPQYSVQ